MNITATLDDGVSSEYGNVELVRHYIGISCEDVLSVVIQMMLVGIKGRS